MPPTVSVTVRINAENLAKLEELGKQAVPKTLNRSEMINVAIADYVARQQRAMKAVGGARKAG